MISKMNMCTVMGGWSGLVKLSLGVMLSRGYVDAWNQTHRGSDNKVRRER
jgi:hypothetical protein